MAGGDDRCPKCGGPAAKCRYEEPTATGVRVRWRCERARQRAAQLRRATARQASPLETLAAMQQPTPAEVAAGQELWRAGEAGAACREAGLTPTQLAHLVGATPPTARRWMTSRVAPQRRLAERATAVLLALGVLRQDATAAPDPVSRPIPQAELPEPARRARDDFEYFRYRYLGSRSVPWQTEAAGRVIELMARPGKTYVVVNLPQGSGKTRTLAHDLVCWLIVRDRTVRGFIGSAGRALSETLTGNVRDTLSRSTPVVARDVDVVRGLAHNAEATLVGDYGPFRGEQLWRRDKFYAQQLDGQPAMHKDPTLAAFSREARFLGHRVDFAIWDDLCTSDMLRNPDTMDDLYRWFDVEAESRIDTDGVMFVVGQRLGANDISRKLLDKVVDVEEIDGDDREPTAPMYHHIVYPAHFDGLCTGAHPKGMGPTRFVDGQPTGSCLLDPAMIGPRDIAEKKAAGVYEVVYQQQDTDPQGVLVRKVWVDGGSEDGATYAGCWDPDRAPGQLPDPLPAAQRIVRYISVDPSPTKYWGLLDVLYVLPDDPAIDPADGFRYVIDIARRKMTAPQFLDRDVAGGYVGLLDEWTQRARDQGHPVEYVIVEKNAAQRFLLQLEHFRSWCATRSVTPIEHETTNNKNDPDFGVWALIPAQWRYGRMRLPADQGGRQQMAPLVAEVTGYPGYPTSDLVMASWFGELRVHDGTIAGPMRTNSQGFYQDQPSWVTGTDRISFAAQRIAEMVARQTGQQGAA